jgi:hypothetical protein
MRMTKQGPEELRNKYVGRKFRYNSKYGGHTDNILCEDISVTERIQIKNGEPIIESCEIYIISDKRNSYDLEDVEFYEP